MSYPEHPPPGPGPGTGGQGFPPPPAPSPPPGAPPPGYGGQAPGQPPPHAPQPQPQPQPPGPGAAYGSYGQAPGGYAGAQQPKQRSRLLRVGLILFGLGAVIAAAGVFYGMQSFPDIDSFPRASGVEQPVELTAGEWTVFAENGSAGPQEILDPSGQPITIEPIFSSQDYNTGGNDGSAVGKIDAPVDGTYLVTNENGTTAFAQNFASDLIRSIISFVVAALLGGLLLLLGFILALVGFFKNR